MTLLLRTVVTVSVLLVSTTATTPPGYVKQPDNDKNPPSYRYNYKVHDDSGEEVQAKTETREGEHAQGRYYVNSEQASTDVKYYADDWGYHPLVKYGTADEHSSSSARLAFGEQAKNYDGDNETPPSVDLPRAREAKRLIPINPPYEQPQQSIVYAGTLPNSDASSASNHRSSEGFDNHRSTEVYENHQQSQGFENHQPSEAYENHQQAQSYENHQPAQSYENHQQHQSYENHQISKGYISEQQKEHEQADRGAEIASYISTLTTQPVTDTASTNDNNDESVQSTGYQSLASTTQRHRPRFHYELQQSNHLSSQESDSTSSSVAEEDQQLIAENSGSFGAKVRDDASHTSSSSSSIDSGSSDALSSNDDNNNNDDEDTRDGRYYHKHQQHYQHHYTRLHQKNSHQPSRDYLPSASHLSYFTSTAQPPLDNSVTANSIEVEEISNEHAPNHKYEFSRPIVVAEAKPQQHKETPFQYSTTFECEDDKSPVTQNPLLYKDDAAVSSHVLNSIHAGVALGNAGDAHLIDHHRTAEDRSPAPVEEQTDELDLAQQPAQQLTQLTNVQAVQAQGQSYVALNPAFGTQASSVQPKYVIQPQITTLPQPQALQAQQQQPQQQYQQQYQQLHQLQQVQNLQQQYQQEQIPQQQYQPQQQPQQQRQPQQQQQQQQQQQHPILQQYQKQLEAQQQQQPQQQEQQSEQSSVIEIQKSIEIYHGGPQHEIHYPGAQLTQVAQIDQQQQQQQQEPQQQQQQIRYAGTLPAQVAQIDQKQLQQQSTQYFSSDAADVENTKQESQSQGDTNYELGQTYSKVEGGNEPVYVVRPATYILDNNSQLKKNIVQQENTQKYQETNSHVIKLNEQQNVNYHSEIDQQDQLQTVTPKQDQYEQESIHVTQSAQKVRFPEETTVQHKVPIPQPYTRPVEIPVPQPYHQPITIEKSLEKKIPIPVHIPVPHPYPVEKPIHIPVPVEKVSYPVEVPKYIERPATSQAPHYGQHYGVSYQQIMKPQNHGLYSHKTVQQHYQRHPYEKPSVPSTNVKVNHEPNPFLKKPSYNSYQPQKSNGLLHRRHTAVQIPSDIMGPPPLQRQGPAPPKQHTFQPKKSFVSRPTLSSRRTRNQDSTRHQKGNFRQSKMEYGFKPPMVPSVQYDEETASKVES